MFIINNSTIIIPNAFNCYTVQTTVILKMENTNMKEMGFKRLAIIRSFGIDKQLYSVSIIITLIRYKQII